MAKIVRSKGRSTYDIYRQKDEKKKVILWSVAVLGIAGAYFTYGISLILCVSLLFLPKKSHYKEILAAGEAGENITEQILRRLPRSYYVVSDVTIFKPNGSNQLDHVVVGSNGVFVVETKNHKGVISGDDSDVKVLQQKQVRGMWQDSRFLNPTKQAATQVRAAKRFMKELGYGEIPVKGIVFFANAEATVKLYSEEIPVFSARGGGGRKLRRYIQRSGKKRLLTPSERKDLAKRFARKKT